MRRWRFDGRADEVKEILDLNDEYLDDMYVFWSGETRKEGAYFRDCTVIATSSSLAEMVAPGAIAVLTPPIVGFLLGRLSLAGLLIGALSSGFMLALTMSNAGGAWDNAKKYVEKGNFGGKYITDEFGKTVYDTNAAGIKKKRKNPVHDANVIGDTVGDPFKDTSGPALNILIKLMSIMSLVLAPRFAQIADDKGLQWDDQWGGGWWIAIVLLGVLLLIVLVANISIIMIVKKFKQRLDGRKTSMENALTGINADAPAMSPARVRKENDAIVEMTNVQTSEDTAAPVEEPAEEAASAKKEEEEEEEEPAVEEAAAPAEEEEEPAVEEAAAPAEEEEEEEAATAPEPPVDEE